MWSATKRQNAMVFGLLLLAWVLMIGWELIQHEQVKQTERTALLNRGRDITGTVGLVIRSQRRFGAFVSQERMESALNELLNSGELKSVALLNGAGVVVASARASTDEDFTGVLQNGIRWGRQTVTWTNLVDLGSNMMSREHEPANLTIVMPKREPGTGPWEDRPPPPPFPAPRRTNEVPGKASMESTNQPPGQREMDNRQRDRGRPRFGRPFGMDESEYQSLIQKQGMHGFVTVMSSQTYLAACKKDWWYRVGTVSLAGLAVIGMGLAWRSLASSSELQMRLIRAGEMNTQLREMNVAAAGLAHETRNPLNIIRGLAQLISNQKDSSTEIRRKSGDIITEVDRVAAQLNEFINYSRPREVRASSTSVGDVLSDVARALQSDLEDKSIHLQISDEKLLVEADEAMLRQVLFNLLLNAIQALGNGGEIHIITGKSTATGAFIEFRDNGPGVKPEHRDDIFKPYFTTHQNGTGLGLAVVRQIVLAHGWDVQFLPNEPKGAVFRVSQMKPVPRT